MSPTLDNMKHIADYIIIPTGAVTSAMWLTDVGKVFTDFVNPILSTIVLLLSAVWGYYRIIELKRKTKQPDKEEE